MLGPAAHVLGEQMAEAETELIWRLHASTKKQCNYAQACSVLIHIVMAETVKSHQAAQDTKLFYPPGITQSLTEWSVLCSPSMQRERSVDGKT